MVQGETSFSSDQISEGAKRLSEWVTTTSEATQKQIGFGWIVDEASAPRTFPQLVEAHALSATTGRPYPVTNKGASSSLYGPAVNAAFRYLHDLTHAQLGQDFSPGGELLVASAQLNQLSNDGFVFGGLEWQLLFADTVGQLIFGVQHEGFVDDQTVFAHEVVINGIQTAVQHAFFRRALGPGHFNG